MSILHNLLSVAILLVTLTHAVPLLKNVGIPEDIQLEKDDTDYRLPTDVKPSHYTIKLSPNIVEDDFTFTGESAITIKLTKENTTDITLHAKDLEFDKTFTTLVDVKDPKKIFKPKTQTSDDKTDFLTLTFDVVLAIGDYTLNLKYSGKLHDDLNGFYRSSYLDARGKKVWLATTQFEPTHARRAFPCFDEPALKATFEISINHDDALRAISNMPITSIEPDDKNLARQWTHFKITPAMSTYLIAFVVSDFASLKSDDGKFRIWSKPNAIINGHYAHLTGQAELKALDEYTAISHYSIISKMDNFAIPQFRAGAMENWGIVTYRESALLFEENVTSTDSKQRIATVISHEFAHQWFGNLVSPLWWDYTWLNEGFANYFEYYITDKVETTWRLMDQFVIKNLQETAFTADDKESQHPMNGKVNSPLEISQFFDSITYSKAGSVIRMISHALTEAVFQKGIKEYLKNNQYKAADSDVLFNELVKAATATAKEVDLKKALDSWANQAGYPVVTVTRDHASGSATITQHRFLTQKSKEPTESWIIPINYATQGELKFDDTKASQWLPNDIKKNTTISGLKKDEWVIFNKQQTGYYRVNYDGTNWELIIKHLKSDKYDQIHVLNRAQLLDDSYHLAQAGELSDYSVFLDISTYLEREVDYVPWVPAFRAFGALNKVLANTPKHNIFKLYILGLIKELENTVGYTEQVEDDHVTKFSRINAINWACSAGSKNCTAAAYKQLLGHIRGSSKISTDLQNVVLCAGIRAANATEWEQTFAFFEKSKDANERKAILAALGCSTDSKVLNSILQKSIVNGSKITPDDVIKSVLVGSPSGVDIAFDFINGKLKEIVAINGGTDSIVKILNEIGSRMTTKAQVDKLNKFINDNKDLAEELKKGALVSANKNVEWIKKYEKTIADFLDGLNLEDKPKPKPEGGNNSSSVSLPALQLIILALIASLVSRFH